MVLLGNAFWKRQFIAVPFEKRLLLLPHCFKHAEGCPRRVPTSSASTAKNAALLDRRLQGPGETARLGQGARRRRVADRPQDHRRGPRRRESWGSPASNVLEKAIDKISLLRRPGVRSCRSIPGTARTRVSHFESWGWDGPRASTSRSSGAADHHLHPAPDAGRQQDRHERIFLAGSSRVARAKDPLEKARTRSRESRKTSPTTPSTPTAASEFRPFITLAAFHPRSSGEIQRTGHRAPR